MKNLFAIIAIAMVSICLEAATPSYNDFNPAYFTRSGNTIGINPTNLVSGAGATNVFLGGSVANQLVTNGNGNWTLIGVTTNETRDVTLGGNTTTTKNILFSSDDQFSIGSPTFRAKHIYAAENVFGGAFFGNGGGVTNLASTNLTGTIDDARLPNIITSDITGNAATSDFAKTSPVQMPSSVFSDWNSGTLLLSLSGTGNEASGLAEASIGSIGDKYALYYTGYDSGNTGRISAAYGSLLNGFTKHGVVLAPTAGQWDASSIGGATHFRERGTNYLYYFGGNNAAGFEVDPLSIGVAYSTDGTNYTKYSGNPIMRSNNVAASCVTCYTWFTKKTSAGYLGFFNAKHSSGAQERIHLATSQNPLGPWTYVSEIYHHTNATITSDFTVADLTGGGYIAAYWILTNGNFRSSFAYSQDLTNWTAVGTGPVLSFVGGRFFYDDGLAYSYCLGQTEVYYTRPKKSNLGAISGTFSGSGAGLTGVSANVANIAGVALALGGDFETYVMSADYDGVSKVYASFGRTAPPLAISAYTFGYDESATRFFSESGWDFKGSITVTNAVNGTNVAVISASGSVINGVGITNNNVTIPGTLNVSGATTIDTVIATTVTGNGSGITNIPVSALTTNGGTPGQVVTAQANGTVTWSNAPASSGGSPVTFDASQFGSSSAGTNLRSGALVTNLTFSGKEFGVYVTNSENNGIQFRAKEDNSVIATLRSSDGISGSGSGLTQLNASSISSGSVADAQLGNALLKSGGVMTGGLGMTGFTNLASGLGTTITPYEWLSNSTLATVGAQQVSPALMLGGNGWSTTGSTSSPVSMGFYTLPVQSTTPTAALHFLTSLNGAAPTSVANLTSAGLFTTATSITSGGSITAGANITLVWGLGWSSKSWIYCPINGVLSLLKADLVSGPDFILLGGGQTAALQWQSTNWPALRVVASTNNPTLGISLGTNITLFASLIASNIQAQGSLYVTNVSAGTNVAVISPSGNQIGGIGITNGIIDTVNTKVPSGDVANGTTTYSDSVALEAVLPVANRSYAIQWVLFVDNTTAADGIKLDMQNGTATVSSIRASLIGSDDTGTIINARVSSLATSTSAATLTGNGVVVINVGVTITTAGTIKVRVAKNSSTTGTVTIRALSNVKTYLQ